MRVGIVGGKLQGIEAVYLSRKAGYSNVLIDKDTGTPASYLSDCSQNIDVLRRPSEVRKVLQEVDVVIPALEEPTVVRELSNICRSINIPLAFDSHAFSITYNKSKSKTFLERSNIPIPRHYPNAAFPVIVKPVSQSGGKGVSRIDNHRELESRVRKSLRLSEPIVIQEFLEGTNLSLEVMGDGEKYDTYLTTELGFDEKFSCSEVLFPSSVPVSAVNELERLGESIGRGLNLKGLTDVQAICSDEGLRIIEINARLPSQTPTVVYHASGINLLEFLVKMFVNGKLPGRRPSSYNAVLYAHFRVINGWLSQIGERVMSNARNLTILQGLFGANEVITNLEHTPNNAVMTVIFKDTFSDRARKRFKAFMEELTRDFRLKVKSR